MLLDEELHEGSDALDRIESEGLSEIGLPAHDLVVLRPILRGQLEGDGCALPHLSAAIMPIDSLALPKRFPGLVTARAG